MSFSVLVDLPSRQVGVLLADALVEELRAYVTSFDPEWTAVTLTCDTREGTSQAEASVKAMIEKISHNIVTRTEYVHPCYVPLFSSAWGGTAIGSVEELYHVGVTFTSNRIPVQEFSRSVLSANAPMLLMEHLRFLTVPTVASSAGDQSVAWSYRKPGGNFSPCTPAESQVLEKLFQFGGFQVMLSGQQCTVDFKEMVVIGPLGEMASLQRSPPSALPEQCLMLKIKGLEQHAISALSNLKDRLKRECKTTCIELNPSRQPIPSYSEQQITNYCRQYCIRFRFENTNGQYVLLIEGPNGYLDSIYPLVKDFLRKLEAMPQLPPATVQRVAVLPVPAPTMCSGPPTAHQRRRPSLWTPQSTPCEFPHIAAHSPEWNEVVSWVRITLPSITVTRLDRVQNCTLWERYELEGRQMLERNSGVTNEMFLFHGTTKTDPYEIASSGSGIDFRYSTRDRKLMWGNGAYFAVNASYSSQYAYNQSDRTKQMMIVSVLTGRAYDFGKNTKPDLTRPPEIAPGRLYDTVKGFSAQSDIYVVYDHCKSCPAYIITYTKK